MSDEIKKQLAITDEDYKAIQQMIESEDSPVGIDAKETHILILKKLVEIEARLARLEKQMEETNQGL